MSEQYVSFQVENSDGGWVYSLFIHSPFQLASYTMKGFTRLWRGKFYFPYGSAAMKSAATEKKADKVLDLPLINTPKTFLVTL